jgi:hypothetical protein
MQYWANVEAGILGRQPVKTTLAAIPPPLRGTCAGEHPALWIIPVRSKHFGSNDDSAGLGHPSRNLLVSTVQYH